MNMQDTYVETDNLTLPLRFAMLASTTVDILECLKDGEPLDNDERHSILALSELLQSAAKGGKVLRDKSLANYSTEAMSAYRLVQKTESPTKEVRRLDDIIADLHGIAAGKRTKIPLNDLVRFFRFLTKRNMDESSERQMIVQTST
jgi:hypothetical protein